MSTLTKGEFIASAATEILAAHFTHKLSMKGVDDKAVLEMSVGAATTWAELLWAELEKRGHVQ